MKTKWMFLTLLLGVLVACNGCLLFVAGGAAAAGAGTVAYMNGELKDSEAVSFTRARTATLAALKDMQYGVVGDEQTPLKETISARTGSDKKVKVILEKESDTVTQIRIRVDIFGDETLSRLVLDKIKAHL